LHHRKEGNTLDFPAGSMSFLPATEAPRHIWWNFVSSSPERIEQAKQDWKENRFPRIPGDDIDFTPLPHYS